MGYNTYTTADLVNNILLVGHVPLGNSTFTTANLINLANRELQTELLQLILSTRGGYYLSYEDYEQASDGLYLIPSQAVGGALVNVELVQNTTIIQVNSIDESEQFSTNAPTSTSYGFFMKGNYVQILPTPPIGQARLWFTKRPSTLIPTSQAAQVSSIASAVYTVISVPSTLEVGDSVDVVGDQPPFNILGTRTITDITGTNITLDTAVTDVAAGDWICLEEQTCVPQIPVEYRPLLEQRVVVKIYELQGYLDKMQMAEKKLMQMEKALLGMISPRVKSQTKVINPINGGFLSGNSNRITNFPAGRIP